MSPVLMRDRFSNIDMVLLVVGCEETGILVHENMLFEASPVFKAAFASRFKESSERSIHLPDDSSTIVDILVQNLYAPGSRLYGIDVSMDLFRLYVFADKYDIVKIKNKICKHIHSFLDEQRRLSARGGQRDTRARLGMSAVEFVYENTTSTAPMRRLLVDWFVWAYDWAWFDSEKNCSRLRSVPEFAVDVCALLAMDFNKQAKRRLFMKTTSLYLEEEPVGIKRQMK